MSPAAVLKISPKKKFKADKGGKRDKSSPGKKSSHTATILDCISILHLDFLLNFLLISGHYKDHEIIGSMIFDALSGDVPLQSDGKGKVRSPECKKYL